VDVHFKNECELKTIAAGNQDSSATFHLRRFFIYIARHRFVRFALKVDMLTLQHCSPFNTVGIGKNFQVAGKITGLVMDGGRFRTDVWPFRIYGARMRKPLESLQSSFLKQKHLRPVENLSQPVPKTKKLAQLHNRVCCQISTRN
jgi:hypothetical protein